MNLSFYFGPEWDITSYTVNGQTCYPGVMVRGQLGLRNSTSAIRGKVSSRNRMLARIEGINHRRSVYMLTIEGVVEMIMNSSTPEANRLKAMMSDVVLDHATELYRQNDQLA